MQKLHKKLFGQVWGNSGKNPSHPQKFACSYTYACGQNEAVLEVLKRGHASTQTLLNWRGENWLSAFRWDKSIHRPAHVVQNNVSYAVALLRLKL